MEFLMTYGWAILVLMVAIGALAYFGVLNPSNLLTDEQNDTNIIYPCIDELEQYENDTNSVCLTDSTVYTPRYKSCCTRCYQIISNASDVNIWVCKIDTD